MNPWTAFWLALAVFIICEAVLTARGLNTFFWTYRTPVELELQKKILEGYKP